MIPIREADALLRPHQRPLPPSRVALERAAGLMLREDIRADRPYPPIDRVCMDGIAIRYGDWEHGIRRFRLAGMAGIGKPRSALSGVGECLEVATGAPCPEGADTVIPYEWITMEGDWAQSREAEDPGVGRNVSPTGSDCTEGAVLIRAGRTLTAPCIGVAASVGLGRLLVTPRPRLALLSTGDELIEVGDRPEPWQLRRSNPAALAALFRGCAEVKTFRSSDHPDELASAIASALAHADMLVVTGGVSAGRFDGVPKALQEAGVRQVFHKVAIRPGKPVWFGIAPGDRPVFALPGNPVASLVCARRFVAPMLLGLSGRPPAPPIRNARLGADLPPGGGLVRFIPVRRGDSPRGKILLYPVSVRGSGDFAGLVHSDGFAEIPEGADSGYAGRAVPYYPWHCTAEDMP